MTYQEYITSKKIDANTFVAAEPLLYATWEFEFQQMHPNSFTLQKLNLINSTRRKYPLTLTQNFKGNTEEQKPEILSPAAPKIARPMMKPKPKIN